GGHPRHRHEDPAAPGHLDDEADDPRAPGGGEGDDDVAYPTDLVAEGVEDLEARQARDEEAAGSTHGPSLTTPTEVPRTSRTGPPVARGDPGGRPGGRARPGPAGGLHGGAEGGEEPEGGGIPPGVDESGGGVEPLGEQGVGGGLPHGAAGDEGLGVGAQGEQSAAGAL